MISTPLVIALTGSVAVIGAAAVIFYLYNKENVLVDSETIPIIKNGKKGDKGDKGDDGIDGTHIEMRYYLFPEGLEPGLTIHEKNNRTCGGGWTTTPKSPSIYQALWMSQAEIDADDNLVGQWSDPVRISGQRGAVGEMGERGLMAYPAGVYDKYTTYQTTATSTPVVLDTETNTYYVLKPGQSWTGTKETYSTPHEDYAKSGSSAKWTLMDKFNSIFANIIMAQFAKLASAVFYDDFMISQQGTLTYIKEYRYKVATSMPTDFDCRADVPTGWSKTFPSNIPSGSSVWYIEAKKRKDGTLVWGEEWLGPIVTSHALSSVTSHALSSHEIIEENSTKYQEYQYGSFQPNYSVNFKTGEINAKHGVFSGSLRTNLKTLWESDAIDVKAATLNSYAGRRFRINKDLELNVSSYTELELPTDPSYIGARITICESAGVYSRNLAFVAITTQDGSVIGGIKDRDSADSILDKSATKVFFLNGVVQFLGVRQWADSDEKPTSTKWMVVSANAESIYAEK